jgi:hypothetical protein
MKVRIASIRWRAFLPVGRALAVRALAVPRNAFPSALDEITVGRMRIGASTCEPEFTGIIDSAELPGLPHQ